jgi:hypothetical protein
VIKLSRSIVISERSEIYSLLASYVHGMLVNAGDRLSLEHIQNRLSDGFSNPSISFAGEVHAVPAECAVMQINNRTKIDITKTSAAGKSPVEHIR